MTPIRVFAATLIAVVCAFGQTPPRPPFDAFEVATIKPTDPNPGGRWIRMQSANRFQAHNHAVRTLIAAAYDLSPQVISSALPSVDSDRWDILAKTPGEVRPNLTYRLHQNEISSTRVGPNCSLDLLPRKLGIRWTESGAAG